MPDYHALSRHIGASTSEGEGLGRQNSARLTRIIGSRAQTIGEAQSSCVDAVTAHGEEPMATVAIAPVIEGGNAAVARVRCPLTSPITNSPSSARPSARTFAGQSRSIRGARRSHRALAGPEGCRLAPARSKVVDARRRQGAGKRRLPRARSARTGAAKNGLAARRAKSWPRGQQPGAERPDRCRSLEQA